MAKTINQCPVCHNHIGRYVQRFYDGTRYSICECSNPECLFYFLNPQLSIEEIASLENKGVRDNFSLPVNNKIAQEISNHNYIVDLVKPWIKERGNIVEIGPGYGYSLAALKNAGYIVTGIEISTMRSEVIENISGASVTDSLDKIDPSISIDGFIMWHVLEHIADPTSFLSCIHRLANEETCLFIQVPSFENLDFYYKNLTNYNSMFTQVHMNYFTQYTLTMLLQNTGFAIIDMIVDKSYNFLTVIAKPIKGTLININSYEKDTFGCVMMDINSNCNLRCKFCINDWKKIRGNINMTEKTFDKILQIIPLSMDEGFFFSCVYEPTIHPNFTSLLKKIPYFLKKKVFFTTNLAKKLSVDQMYDLSTVNINHINISLESLDPKIYEKMRVGAKFDIFFKNLNNLVSIFKKNINSPKIRFITMVFKDNYNEIIELIKVCRSLYLSDSHEIRVPFPYLDDHIDKDFAKNNFITDEEFISLSKYICKLQSRTKLVNPGLTLDDTEGKSENINLDIRIDSDGTVKFPDNTIYNINDLENPYKFFKNKLYQMKLPAGSGRDNKKPQ